LNSAPSLRTDDKGEI